MNARYLTAIVLALAAQHAWAAPLPVYTTEPSDPQNLFKINLVNFNQLNSGVAGLFHARNEFSASDPPTYVALDAAGNASFWLSAPLDLSHDSIHALISMEFPDWRLWSGGYIENANTWRLFLPVSPDAFPDFTLTGASEATISMSPPTFLPDLNPSFQHMLVGLSLSANNGSSKALLFDWTLRQIPEPSAAVLLATAGILMAAGSARGMRGASAMQE